MAQSTATPAISKVTNRPWLDSQRELDERVDALLSEMTLAEKVGQLTQLNGIGSAPTGGADNMVADSALYERIRQGQLGSVLNEINTPTINALQRVAVNESRLGVPLVIGRDVIHGFRTIFPIPLGQAASWNPELIEAASAVAAREARSIGIHWTFAPMVDIARDPRLGPHRRGVWRGSTPGERDGGRDRSAVFRATISRRPIGSPRVRSTLSATARAEGGRDYNTTVISPSLMRNVYLPSFHAAVDAGVATLMTSFNDVNGVPSSGNKLVRAFKDTLQLLGFDPWLDEDAMVAGTKLERGIPTGFERSCAAVFFVTPNFSDENYLATEVDYAIQE